MKRKLFLLLFIGLNIFLQARCQEKINLDYFSRLLNDQHKSKMVLDTARKMRSGVYGKCPIVDYFIAKSMCNGGQLKAALEWYKYILKNYPLETTSRRFIESEILNCASPVQSQIRLEARTLPLFTAGVRSNVKGGVTYDCYNEDESPEESDQFFSEGTLTDRLFNLPDSDHAKHFLEKLVGEDYNVHAIGRFILVTLKNDSGANGAADDIMNELEKAKNFFVSNYNLSHPQKLITVYLLPDIKTLQRTAKKVHGLVINSSQLGYSVRGDLSLLGIASTQARGSLFHELFHLLIRSDIGDIPAWLDEGMACLYSNYIWEGQDLVGYNQPWRLGQLQYSYLAATGQYVPVLHELFDADWEQFYGGVPVNRCKGSVNYAMVNFFLIYLQENGLLQKMVSGFKHRGSGNEVPDNSISVITKILGKDIAVIEKDFDIWFANKYNFPLLYRQATDKRIVDPLDIYSKPLASKKMAIDLSSLSIEEQYAAIKSSLERIESRLLVIASKPKGTTSHALEPHIIKSFDELERTWVILYKKFLRKSTKFLRTQNVKATTDAFATINLDIDNLAKQVEDLIDQSNSAN